MDVIGRFLNSRLITVGAEDSRLEVIGNATGALADQLLATPRLIVSFASAAMNPSAGSDSPSIKAAAQALAEVWKTYQGAFADPPIGLFRAMIAGAIYQAGDKNIKLAAAYTYLVQNWRPNLVLGAEAEIWDELIGHLAQKTEAAAERLWTGSAAKTPAFELAPLPIKLNIAKTQVDVKGLTDHFGAAAGPHNQANTAYPNPNPNWTNSVPAWSYEFAPRAAAGVAQAVNQVAVSGEVETDEFAKAIVNGLNDFGRELGQMGAANNGALWKRSSLLWWKEALYSPSAMRSYRGLSDVSLASLLAGDLLHLINELHPQSVEYFLRETIRGVAEDAEKSRKVAEWIELAKANKDGFDIFGGSKFWTASVDDQTLLVSCLSTHGPASSELHNLSLTCTELAVWLLRELQALRMAGTKPK